MTSELPAKLAKLGETHNAVSRMRKALADATTPAERIACAVNLQQLRLDAAELRGTLPKPKLVVNNDR